MALIMSEMELSPRSSSGQRQLVLLLFSKSVKLIVATGQLNCRLIRSSRLLQQEYPELQKRYWGKHFWAIGYGAWSTGNLTEQLVEEYLEHHRNPSNQERDNFLLE